VRFFGFIVSSPRANPDIKRLSIGFDAAHDAKAKAEWSESDESAVGSGT
jgi:hypothetical protein